MKEDPLSITEDLFSWTGPDKKTNELISSSDLCLVFLESFEDHKYESIKNKIFVRSKLDIRKVKKNKTNITNISSVTGQGVDLLVKKIKQKLVKYSKKQPILSRERHISIMENVLKELKSVKKNDSMDVKAFKYREALRLSLEFNQKFDIEDILDIIFRDFCIGK